MNEPVIEVDKNVQHTLIGSDHYITVRLYLKGLKKRLIQSKLIDVSKGKISTDYRMIYPLK
jgi:hypothetical protein